MQQPAVGVRDDVGVEVDVDLGRAEHGGVDERGEVALAVPVVAGERAGHDVVGVVAHRADAVQVEGLAVEDVVGEALFEHLDEVFRAAAADEAGLDLPLAHVVAEVDGEAEGGAAGAGLEAEAVAHDADVADELGGHFGDHQAVGALGQLGGAGDDLARVADLVEDDDLVHVVALNLPRHAGERHEVVGHHDHVVGVQRIDQAEAEAAARGRAVDAVGVAEGVAGRGGEDGDVDVDLAILDGLPAAAVGAEDAEAAHLAGGAVVAERAVHAALDVVDDAGLDERDERGVAGEAGGREPDEVFDAELGGGLEERDADLVAVAEVVVGGDAHAVAEAGVLEGDLQDFDGGRARGTGLRPVV